MAAALDSPCVKICVVDPASGLRAGCGRKVEEIATWSELDAEARRAVLARLPEQLGRSRLFGPRAR
jgi:hypothetical protein